MKSVDHEVARGGAASAGGDEGFVHGQHALLFHAEQGHFWFDSGNVLILWALRRFFPPAESLLEVGCGTAYVSAAIERALPEIAGCGAA